jgi:hypothetical protein
VKLRWVYCVCLAVGFESNVIQLNREICHENIVALKEVILEDKSIYMVFEYAEHDFLVSLLLMVLRVSLI